jgi:hypothetical protein
VNATFSHQPFAAALGSAAGDLAPAVRQHFLQSGGVRQYRGVMRRVWRRRGLRGALAWPFLAIGSRTDNVFSQAGVDIPFELTNRVTPLPDGRLAMTWERAFHFADRTQRFVGLCVFDEGRGTIIDWLGRNRRLEVELIPTVENRGVLLRSARQRWRLGPITLAIPRWLVGHAIIREWQEPDGAFGISLIVTNSLLGPFFGYEGTFSRYATQVPPRIPPAAKPDAPSLLHRLTLAAVAILGTLAFAASFANLRAPHPLLPIAAAVGLAAGVSWLAFSLILLVVTGARPSITDWIDACLRTMARGIAVLSIATLANFTPLPLRALLFIHGIALATSNLVMAVTFAARARRLGLAPLAAVAFWIVGLNATFAAILFALMRIGAF